VIDCVQRVVSSPTHDRGGVIDVVAARVDLACVNVDEFKAFHVSRRYAPIYLMTLTEVAMLMPRLILLPTIVLASLRPLPTDYEG